jgi:predicted phosphate transport protein (TIGR00153 family)
VSPRSGRGGVATIRRALCAKFAALRDNFRAVGIRTGRPALAHRVPSRSTRRPRFAGLSRSYPPTAGTYDKIMALNLFRRLMPPEKSFTVLFREQADCMVDAAEELRDMVGQREVAVEAHIASIRAIETKSDAVVRQIFLSANRTFNAPIDREDILTLAHELDDVVDLIEDTAKGIQRYAMSEFPAEMQTMVNAVVESAELLKKAMPYLDSITRDYREIYGICQRIGQIEEQADEAFDGALSRIRAELRAGSLDAIGYLDRKELYEWVERVVDKCDDVANQIQTITAKHV